MKKSWMILCFSLILGLFASCGGAGEVAYVQSVGMLAGIGPAGALMRFGGIVAPQSTASVDKAADLTIGEMKVREGDEVKKGDLLFVYDADESRLNLEKARTELEQLKMSLLQNEKDLETLKKEKEKASKDQKLAYTLEIQETETNILELKYNLSEKEKEIARLEESLENLEVRAPVTGRIQSLNENGGSDSMGNPLPFMTIVETGRMRVKGTLNEQNVLYMSEGMPVLIRSRLDGTTWRGTVAAIDWEKPVSQSSDSYYGAAAESWEKGVPTTAEVPNEGTSATRYPFYVELESDEGLLMGQHVYIEPDVGENGDEAALVLDAAFFSDAAESPWVWAENQNGRLEKRSVTLGAYDEMRSAYPVLSGLGADDNIAFPEERLREGMRCVPYEEAEIDPDVVKEGGWNAEEPGYEEEFADDRIFEGAIVGGEESFDFAGIEKPAESEAYAASEGGIG